MRALVLLPVILAVSVATAHAQDIRGHLQGRVIDSAGNAIGTVGIVLRSPELQGERSTVSDRNGHFVLRWLPVGNYEVELDRIGYGSLVLEGVAVRLGRTTTVGEVQLAVTPQQWNIWYENQDGERVHILDKYNLHCDFDWNCTQERVGGICSPERIDSGPPVPLP